MRVELFPSSVEACSYSTITIKSSQTSRRRTPLVMSWGCRNVGILSWMERRRMSLYKLIVAILL